MLAMLEDAIARCGETFILRPDPMTQPGRVVLRSVRRNDASASEWVAWMQEHDYEGVQEACILDLCGSCWTPSWGLFPQLHTVTLMPDALRFTELCASLASVRHIIVSPDPGLGLGQARELFSAGGEAAGAGGGEEVGAEADGSIEFEACNDMRGTALTRWTAGRQVVLTGFRTVAAANVALAQLASSDARGITLRNIGAVLQSQDVDDMTNSTPLPLTLSRCVLAAALQERLEAESMVRTDHCSVQALPSYIVDPIEAVHGSVMALDAHHGRFGTSFQPTVLASAEFSSEAVAEQPHLAGLETAVPLRPHQCVAIRNFHRDVWEGSVPGKLLVHDTGTGKTVQAVWLAAEAIAAGRVEVAVIVATKSVLPHYIDTCAMLSGLPRREVAACVRTDLNGGDLGELNLESWVSVLQRFVLLTDGQLRADMIRSLPAGEPRHMPPVKHPLHVETRVLRSGAADLAARMASNTSYLLHWAKPTILQADGGRGDGCANCSLPFARVFCGGTTFCAATIPGAYDIEVSKLQSLGVGRYSLLEVLRRPRPAHLYNPVASYVHAWGQLYPDVAKAAVNMRHTYALFDALVGSEHGLGTGSEGEADESGEQGLILNELRAIAQHAEIALPDLPLPLLQWRWRRALISLMDVLIAFEYQDNGQEVPIERFRPEVADLARTVRQAVVCRPDDPGQLDAQLRHFVREEGTWLEWDVYTGVQLWTASWRVPEPRCAWMRMVPRSLHCNPDPIRPYFVVLDEAHRFTPSSITQMTKTAIAARKLVHEAAGSLMMTATPYRNGPHELVQLLRLLRPDVPVDIEHGQDGLNISLLKRLATGAVSVHHKRSRTFAAWTDVNVRIPLSTEQQLAENAMLVSAVKTRWSGRMSGMHVARMTAGDVAAAQSALDAGTSGRNAYYMKTRQLSNVTVRAEAAEELLAASEETELQEGLVDWTKPSLKVRAAVDIALGSPGPTLVFSNFRKTGIHSFLHALRAGAGCVRLLSPGKLFGTWRMVQVELHGTPGSGRELHGTPGSGREVEVACIDGSMSSVQRATTLAWANSPTLEHECRILCITKAGYEGVNLINFRTVVALDSGWHEMENLQVRSRVLRSGGHAALSAEDRTVHSVRFVCERSDGAESTDCVLLARRMAKRRVGCAIDALLEEVSDECREVGTLGSS